MFVFRRSAEADLDTMARIAAEGKALLKSRGISQWQRGTYPDRAVFERDIADGIGYVVEEDGEVVAVCAVTFTDEACYRGLTGGSWKTSDDARYATVHRSAVAAAHRGRHISTFLFDAVAALAQEQHALSVRADTHPDNLGMQAALARAGFVKCGELVLTSGDEAGDLRLGYERLL